MKKVLFLLLFAMISIVGYSQTQRIAHRSHSGKDHYFTVSATSDNFGLPVPDSSKKIKTKTAVKKDSTKTAPKDSLKPAPRNPAIDTIRNLATRQRVYAILHAGQYISTHI